MAKLIQSNVKQDKKNRKRACSSCGGSIGAKILLTKVGRRHLVHLAGGDANLGVCVVDGANAVWRGEQRQQDDIVEADVVLEQHLKFNR